VPDDDVVVGDFFSPCSSLVVVHRLTSLFLPPLLLGGRTVAATRAAGAVHFCFITILADVDDEADLRRPGSFTQRDGATEKNIVGIPPPVAISEDDDGGFCDSVGADEGDDGLLSPPLLLLSFTLSQRGLLLDCCSRNVGRRLG